MATMQSDGNESRAIYHGRLVTEGRRGKRTRDFPACSAIEYFEKMDGTGIEITMVGTGIVVTLDSEGDAFYCMLLMGDGTRKNVSAKTFNSYIKRWKQHEQGNFKRRNL